MQGKAAAHDWAQMSDEELTSAARYYVWLALTFPAVRNHRLDEIIAEVNRRGKPEILKQAKTSIHRREAT